MMGRQKKDGNHFLPNNKLLQQPEGNEENRYPDPNSNKTKINYAKDPKSSQELSERSNPVSNQ
jgi:hypothetical protein